MDGEQHPSGTAAFLDWLERDSDSIAQLMFDAVVEATPSVVVDGSRDARLLLESLRSHLPRAHAAVSDGDASRSGRLPRAADRWARRLAVAGVDLSELILAYDAGSDAMIRAFVDDTRVGPHRVDGAHRGDALEAGLEGVTGYVRTALTGAITAYVEERNGLARREDSEKRETVLQLLAGEISERVAEESLGYRFAATHLAFVVWSHESSGAQLDRTVPAIRNAFDAWQHLFIAAGPQRVEGWVSLGQQRVDEVEQAARGVGLPSGVEIAFGAPLPGTDGFRVSHRQAREAHRLQRHAHRPAGAPVLFSDVAVMALLSGDAEMTRSFVTAEIGPLLDPQHETLLATLQAWTGESGSPTRAARRLHVHPNTVVKRLDRIKRLIPRPLDAQSLRLRVAAEIAPLLLPGGSADVRP